MKSLQFYRVTVFFIILGVLNNVLAEKYIGIIGAPVEVNPKTSGVGEYPMGEESIVHWYDPNVSWYLFEDGAGDGLTFAQTQSAVQPGFNTWQNISTSGVGFSYIDPIANPWGYDDYNVVQWAEEGDEFYDYYDQTVFAVTIISVNVWHEFLDADIVFNGHDKVWKIDGSEPDIQAVATHEIGHLIGLAHTEVSTSPKPTMRQGYDIGWRSLEWDDQVGASFLYGGNLIDNETFSGNDFYNWDLTVASGKTLTISPDANINFGTDVSLTVNGTIDAQGTQADPIRFTSATGSSPSSWHDIKLTTGNSVFKYCTFEYGRYPIRLTNATSGTTTLIENCEMKNNTYGMYSQSSKAKVKSCNLHNNTHGVFSLGSTQLDFTATNIHDNTSRGVYSYLGGLVQFYGSVINNNGTYGVYTLDSDVINIGCPYTWAGYNTVSDNGSTEVYAGTQSPIVRICYSSVHDGDGLEVYNDAGNSYSVSTLQGFWDTDSCQYQGNVVFYTPYNYLPDWDGDVRTGGPLGKSLDDDVKLFPKSEEERIGELKKIIAEQPGCDEAEPALIELYSLIRGDYVEDRLGEKEGFYGYLEDLVEKHGDEKLGKQALRYQIIWDMLGQRDDRAISLSQKALKVLDKEEQGYILLDMAYVYLHLGSSEKARECLLDLEGRSVIESEMLLRLEEDIRETDDLIAKGLIQPDESLPSETTEELPEEAALLQNYPNPCNPTTTIVYSLSKISDVLVQVFDVRGRLVQTLVNGIQESGRHTILWNGADREENAVSSGIYFYRIRVGEKLLTRKMLLVR